MSILKENFDKVFKNNQIKKNYNHYYYSTCNGKIKVLESYCENLNKINDDLIKNEKKIKDLLNIIKDSYDRNNPDLKKLKNNINNFNNTFLKFINYLDYDNNKKKDKINDLEVECNYLKKKIKDLDNHVKFWENKVYLKNK